MPLRPEASIRYAMFDVLSEADVFLRMISLAGELRQGSSWHRKPHFNTKRAVLLLFRRLSDAYP